jgi:hypothetical protein
MCYEHFLVNGMIRREVEERVGFPLGDETFRGELLKVGREELVAA